MARSSLPRTYAQRIRRRFIHKVNLFLDNAITGSTFRIVVWLGLFQIIVIAATALSMVLFRIHTLDDDSLTYLEAAWESLTHILDPGTIAGDSGWRFRLLMLLITILGIFMVSVLTSVITAGIQRRLSRLSLGRTPVDVEGHILIVGWSLKIYAIVRELITDKGQGVPPNIVILARKSKDEMKELLRNRLGNIRKPHIITRSGYPFAIEALEMVNYHKARSIIVLQDDGCTNDNNTIKSLLALHQDAEKISDIPVIVEISDPKNLTVSKIASNGRAIPLLKTDLLARLLVQTARQSGLSYVFDELTRFQGSEICIRPIPNFNGKTFAEIRAAMDKAIPLGFLYPDGKHELNPPAHQKIKPGDQILALALHPSQITSIRQHPVKADHTAIADKAYHLKIPERYLILGWNPAGPIALQELDSYLAPGSQVCIVADSPDLPGDLDDLSFIPKHLAIQFRRGRISDRHVLEEIDLENTDAVVVLCYRGNMSSEDADAETMIALLHLRDLAETHGYRYRLISEMLHLRNTELASVSRSDDFVVGDQMVSNLMAQLAYQPALAPVFHELLDDQGMEIYLKSIALYIQRERCVSFATVMSAASNRDEIAIGYRIMKHAFSADQRYGIHLNPPQNELISFSEGDKVIVLANGL